MARRLPELIPEVTAMDSALNGVGREDRDVSRLALRRTTVSTPR